MIKRTIGINVYLQPQKDLTVPAFKVVQDDNHVYELSIKVMDSTGEIDYTKISSATITFAKADGTVVQGDLIKGANALTYPMGTNEIACPGTVYATVQLIGTNNERLTTSKVMFEVVGDLITPDAVKSTTEYPILQQLTADTEALNASISEAEAVRVSTETARMGAEALRDEAEATRVSAETERVASEAERVTGYANMNVQLADMAKYFYMPIATYTHTSNKEVVVSAVDVATDTFISVGHGLANGDKIGPTLNSGVNAKYPPDLYPTGLVAGRYYVVGATADTFQLSLTSGGAAIDLTANVNMDLTKWHFERSLSPAIIITGIPASSKLKLKVRGKVVFANSDVYLNVNNIAAFSSNTEYIWVKTGGTTFGLAANSSQGNMMWDAVYEITSGDILTKITLKNFYVKSNTALAFVSGQSEVEYFTRDSRCLNLEITSIGLSFYGYDTLANGSVLEVYKV